MMKYRIGPLRKVTAPRPQNVIYNKTFKPKQWNNLPSLFDPSYVWSMNGVVYYSYYDDDDDNNYQFRLDGDNWIPVTWEGYDKIDGNYVWVAYGKYYYSTKINNEYKHYRIDGKTLTEVTFAIEFTGGNIWTPDISEPGEETAYVVVDGVTYEYNNVYSRFSRSLKYQGLDNNLMWSDGDKIYNEFTKVYNGASYYENSFDEHKFTFMGEAPQNYAVSLSYTDGSRVYILQPNSEVLVGNSFFRFDLDIPNDVPIGIFRPIPFWSDGVNIYLTSWFRIKGSDTVIKYSYVWEPASTPNFEHELPSTANTVTINLYMNNSEKNVIGKSLTSVRNLNGTFKQEADIINLSTQVDLSSLPNFNYIRVPLFNRYYFVDNIVNLRDDLWEISCHVDVLESFKDTIMSTYGLIERNEFEFNPKIIDHLRVIEQGVTTEVLTDGMTLETVLNDGVPQTMTETSPRFMLVGTFMNLEGEIL